MSKTSFIALFLLVAGTAPLSAQGRPDSTAMSCGQAAALVQSRGALILGTGGMTYDRYVSDRRFCAPTEQVKAAFAPTADARLCPVGYTCFEPFVSPSDSLR